jgi:DNA-binding NarL/FixJ family response regulator
MKARILLADDHSIFRQGIRALLEQHDFNVVAEADNGVEAVDLAQRLAPDVAVLDIAMPEVDGFEATRRIRETCSTSRVVLLSAYEEDTYASEAQRLGAHGYVSKVQAVSDLVAVIHRVMSRTPHARPRLYRSRSSNWPKDAGSSDRPLTPRERQVLQLIALGKTTKELATILGISMKTADSHRSHIMSKLAVHETSSLVRYAVRRGIIHA